jgi:hypothetical protein
MLMIQNHVNENQRQKIPNLWGSVPSPTRKGKEIESIPFCVGFVLMFWREQCMIDKQLSLSL